MGKKTGESIQLLKDRASGAAGAVKDRFKDLKDRAGGKGKNKHHVPFFLSLKGKIDMIFLFSIVLTIVVVFIIIIPVSRRTMSTTIKNYMLDEAESNGKLVDLECAQNGPDKVLGYSFLGAVMKDVGVEGMDSSSAFLINLEGKVMWDQDPKNIGKRVKNNPVLNDLSQQLQSGKKMKNDVTTYTDSSGKKKYCAYFVSTRSSVPFIYVLSVDEEEILEPVEDMANIAIFAGIIVAIAITVFGIFFMKRSLKPVDEMRHYVRRMGEELDFREDETIERLGRRKDEFGRMARSLIFLQGRLSETIASIKGQSEKLFSSSDVMMKNASNMAETSGQVNEAVSDIAQGASSQEDSTRETTDSINEMGSMIEETSDRVRTLTEASDSMKEAQETAQGILSDLDRINKQTMEAVEEIARQTQKTNDSTKEIREVTNLISSIAEETNLLSLNASIEAARAGEAGKGFAVVAEEIGKLADQSNSSAKQIEKIIGQLVEDAKTSVRTMDSVRTITARQSKDIGRTGEAFEKIISGINATNESVDAIRSSMDRMEESRGRVVDSIENLQAVAAQNAASTEQSSASVTEMNRIAGSMQEKSGDLRDIAEVLKNDMNQFRS